MNAPGYVQGYAYASESVLEEHKAAAKEVAGIDRGKAIEHTEHLYGRNFYQLNPDLTDGLTDLQKVVLANGGPAPFGGSVEGRFVTVWND